MYNPTIHWHLTKNYDKGNREKLFEEYAATLEALKLRVKESIIDTTFKERAQQVFRSDADAILKIADTFNADNSNNIFQQEINKLFSEISQFKPYGAMGITTADFEKYGQKGAEKETKKIDEWFEGLEKGYQQIGAFFKVPDVKGFFLLCAKARSGGDLIKKMNVPELDRLMRTSKNQYNAQMTMAQFQKLNTQAKGIMVSFAKYTHINPYMLKSSQDKSAIAKAIKDYLNAPLRRLIGYTYEHIVEGFNQDVLEQLVGTGARIEHYGAKSMSGPLEYSAPTTDLKIIPGQGGKIKVSVPIGVSVKAASASKRHALNIKFKDSTLGKMIDILGARNFISNTEYNAYANIIANYKRPARNDRKGRRRSKKANWQYENGKRRMADLNITMNKLLLITGMAGSMSDNDFTTMLIVNDKVMNVYDILRETLKYTSTSTNTDITGGVTNEKIEDISKEHKWIGDANSNDDSIKRRQAINDRIRSMHINLHLALSDTILNTLLKRF